MRRDIVNRINKLSMEQKGWSIDVMYMYDLIFNHMI